MNWLEKVKEKFNKYKVSITLIGMSLIILATFGTCHFSEENEEKEVKPTKGYEQDVSDLPDSSSRVSNEELEVKVTPRPTVKTPVVTVTPAPTVEPVDTKTPKPTVTPDVKDPHPNGYHNFGSWYSLNDELEERVCSCGAKETRPHKYKSSNKVISNENGTHKIVYTYTCVNCNHQKKKEITKNCDYKFIRYDDEKEYLACTCGHQITRLHSLDKGTKDNEGNITYKCTNKGCGYKKFVKHEHNYEIVNYDDEKEYLKCSCGLTDEREHRLDLGKLNADGSTTYKCLNNGCGYQKTIEKVDPHKHVFVLVDWDAGQEYYECSCGNTRKDSHSLGPKETKDDGTIVRKCTHEGCGYENVHMHTTHQETEPVNSDTVCYKIVISCSECGELYSTNIEHDFVLIYEGRKKDLYCCTVCGKEIERDKPVKQETDSKTKSNSLDMAMMPESHTLKRKRY